MQITFGKFSGMDTNDLARTTEGRSYLAWGAEKLQSPKWRQEFSRALSQNPASGIDVVLEAQAILADDPQLDWNDAQALARERKVDLEDSERFEKALEQARVNLVNALKTAGVPDNHINKIVRLIIEDGLDTAIQYQTIRFSSPQRRQQIEAIAEQYQRELDRIKI